MVRAKFKVDSIERQLTSKRDEKGEYISVEMQTVKLSPVYSSVEGSENKKFWEASPSGMVQLGCINLEAARAFELGKEYYIDFTKAN